MKVLVIIDSLGFGGAEHLLGTLSTVAPLSGLELQVACLAPWSAERASMVPRLEAAGIYPRSLGVRRLADPWGPAKIARAVRASGCDIVHAHLGYSATLVPIAARRAGRPSVCTLHTLPERSGGRELIKERLCIEAASRSGAFVFVSEAARLAFAERYGSRTTWRVVHNGIDLEIWCPGPARLPEQLGIPDGAPVVSIVAALRREKGHALAVQAWPAVLARVPEARLLIIGDGPEGPALRHQVERLGLAHRVVFAGRRDDERERASLVRASDIVLLPSYTEALPTTLIEAAACARPVIATDVGGTPEVVDHATTGLLLARGQAGAIAGAVSDLLVDPSRRHTMGLAARMVAEQRFDMGIWARRLRTVYDDVIAGSRP